jgi:hypothetical protein
MKMNLTLLCLLVGSSMTQYSNPTSKKTQRNVSSNYAFKNVVENGLRTTYQPNANPFTMNQVISSCSFNP